MAAPPPPAIDHVRPPGGGRIGLVRCPGTQPPGGFLRRLRPEPATAELDASLATLRAWPARALVTLLQPHELTLLGAEGLGERAQAVGFEWFHLPITDGAAPGSAHETAWQEVGPRLHSLLDGGERIIVHCRAGLGRSGTIAAQLLIERGAAVTEAIRSVRAARPGAIESGEQELWLQAIGGERAR